MDKMVSKYSFHLKFSSISHSHVLHHDMSNNKLLVSEKWNKSRAELLTSTIKTCLPGPCRCSQNFSIWTTDVLPYLAIKRDFFVLCFFWCFSSLHQIQQQPEPTVHVDAFLYDEDFIDSLCEEGKMSRYYCMVCGSHQTAPLGGHSSLQTWWLRVYFSLHVMSMQIFF